MKLGIHENENKKRKYDNDENDDDKKRIKWENVLFNKILIN